MIKLAVGTVYHQDQPRLEDGEQHRSYEGRHQIHHEVALSHNYAHTSFWKHMVKHRTVIVRSQHVNSKKVTKE